MSTELSNTDKLREFVEELKRLKIKIVRPDINSCFADFKSETKKIFYALSGIKSVGREAISNIVMERENNGLFKSIKDFIQRVNPKDINKLQLEGLVKAGAFDSLEKNRKTLFESIPRLIQLNKKNWEDKISKQSNLFSNDKNDENIIFEVDKSKTWSSNEILMNEFHSIGFYMSNHPLKIYEEYFKHSNVTSFNDFINGSENSALVAGTIMSIQEKKSSKGTPFAIIKFSDLKSEFELFLFSDLLISNRSVLKTANSFILTLQKDSLSNGSTSRRINIKNLKNLNDFIQRKYEKVVIEINGKSDLTDLKETIKEGGDTRIEIRITKTGKTYVFLLKNPRKFDFNTFLHIKTREYVKKVNF